MKMLIHGRNLEVTPALREYTQSKLKKAIHHFEEMVKEADVHLSVAKNPSVPQQTAEVTVFASGTVIRAQERNENLYASIDLVADKLNRQLRRFKERLNDHHHNQSEKSPLSINSESTLEGSLIAGKEVHLPNRGVRRKYFAMPAMSVEKAMEQLDLIDHDFYLFREEGTKELQVIYRRHHGGYGLIQARD